MWGEASNGSICRQKVFIDRSDPDNSTIALLTKNLRACEMVKLAWRLMLVAVSVIVLQTQTTSKPIDARCQGTTADKWREECKWCYCENGKPRCAPESCTEAQIESAKHLPECVNQPTWYRVCNKCTCNNGRADCTKLNCTVTSSESESQAFSGSFKMDSQFNFQPSNIFGMNFRLNSGIALGNQGKYARLRQLRSDIPVGLNADTLASLRSMREKCADGDNHNRR